MIVCKYYHPHLLLVVILKSFNRHGISSASAWLPLCYDTLVLVLTLNCTLGAVRNKTAGKIARVLLRDGILYYRSAIQVFIVY